MSVVSLRSHIQRAGDDRKHKRLTIRRILFENGLSLVLFGLFLACWMIQTLTGLRTLNAENIAHGHSPVSLSQYLGSGHFWEATGENWESEFLQMAAFVWLTSFLYQKGSPESNDPYEEITDPPLKPDSPRAARAQGWVRKIYENSLTLTLLLLFALSFVLHVLGGYAEHTRELGLTGQSAISLLSYMRSSPLWFESMQNWQSEFLSIGAFVTLSIFLRQKGSPESKKVNSSHADHD